MSLTADTPCAPARREPRESATNRKVNWDVIRVLAVFAVVVQHASHSARINHPELGASAFEFPLQIGASALVVISAFFACASLAKGRPRHFVRARLARLLPPYLVAVLLTYGVITAFAPPGWNDLRPRDLAFNLLMLQNWIPDVRFVDHSYWTLPVQVSGFLVAAALFGSRLGSGRGLRVVLWLLPTMPLVVRLFTDDVGWLRTLHVGLALHRVHLFALGVALWLWSKDRLPGWQAAVLAGLGLYAHFVHTGDGPSTVGLAVLLAAMAAAAAGPDWNGVLLRPFTGAIRWLAGISYGVYLLNQQIGYLLMYRVHELGGTALPQLAVAVASAVLLGWLLTRFVERPAHRVLMDDAELSPRMKRMQSLLSWLTGARLNRPAAVPLPGGEDRPLLPALLVTSQLR